MDRFIGMDVHASSSTLAIVGPTGKRIRDFALETNGKALVEAVTLVPGCRHLCLEEGPRVRTAPRELKLDPEAELACVGVAGEGEGEPVDLVEESRGCVFLVWSPGGL